jgi:Cu+-exporting ATPase
MDRKSNTADHDHPHDENGHRHPFAMPGSQKVKDQVCGMMLDPPTSKHRAEAAGSTYYFCSSKCREKFVAEPTR